MIQKNANNIFGKDYTNLLDISQSNSLLKINILFVSKNDSLNL